MNKGTGDAVSPGPLEGVPLMTTKIAIGDRVALTATFVKYAAGNARAHGLAKLRGEVIAHLGWCAVVQWDGVPDEEANHTYNLANLCKPRSVAFTEVRNGNPARSF